MVKSSTVVITLLVAMATAAPIPIGAKNTPSHLNDNKPRLEAPTLAALLLNPDLFKTFNFSGLVEPVGEVLASPPS
ncbi:hypothetical protein IFM61606_01663 [Aspergillus udagawae]|uniref:Uncharacterized protein n=1 Tax=Aspergillus udagawae TaxID=91492 RepID=A0A8H3XNU0_9EURO|nr:uncharacterized protein Aud_001125 [Aspergillus udagawae]GFF40890.1 hypothetical protein IFM51744_04617 [Aspergillus udagawae]GFF55516.1 hypothetical protein IFM46972_10285 [Aspergillus udagawae]GFF81179.1 hypothetical protein IFM53868_03056 [Aspergillus udagawae]GFG04171.1 hypothetical protein IFM5058_01792 [Aspergillus udagawae]GFG21812.1 hypothetical protein IFM61606_01663 [Aspergillus udagawae]